LKIVFGKHYSRSAECIGLDHIAADREKFSVNVLNNVGTAQHQEFVATFLAPEIVDTGIAHLDVAIAPS